MYAGCTVVRSMRCVLSILESCSSSAQKVYGEKWLTMKMIYRRITMDILTRIPVAASSPITSPFLNLLFEQDWSEVSAWGQESVVLHRLRCRSGRTAWVGKSRGWSAVVISYRTKYSDMKVTLLFCTRTDARISSGSPIRPKAGMFLVSCWDASAVWMTHKYKYYRECASNLPEVVELH
jgi:hypothetical protein